MIHKIYKELKGYYTSKLGTREARHIHKAQLNIEMSLKRGIEDINSTYHVDRWCTDNPIFILSAGWRSGSTLLQRLIMSEGQVMIWGEPYGRSGIIQYLSQPIKAFTRDWPTKEAFRIIEDVSELSNNWVANLSPDIQRLYDSNVAYMNTLFGNQCDSLGIKRWGIKEVRWTADHAYFLQWLFPKAKFIFLIRNPFDAYRSYYAYRRWYDIWPQSTIFTPKDFGAHWNKLVNGFLNEKDNLGGMIIKYEELLEDDSMLNKVEEYLEININHSILNKKIGSTKNKDEVMTTSDIFALRKEVHKSAKIIGYGL